MNTTYWSESCRGKREMTACCTVLEVVIFFFALPSLPPCSPPLPSPPPDLPQKKKKRNEKSGGMFKNVQEEDFISFLFMNWRIIIQSIIHKFKIKKITSEYKKTGTGAIAQQ